MEGYKTELEKRNILRLSNEESHRLTKECIQTALIDLMTQKPFKDITISEVIARSGISRSAFYRNYSSKEEIVKEICEEIFSLFKDYAITRGTEEGTYSFFYGIFSAVKENQDRIKLLVQANIEQIFSRSPDSLTEMLRPSDRPDDRYRDLALEGACNMILIDWFKKGMKESVEHMAELCVDITSRIKG